MAKFKCPVLSCNVSHEGDFWNFAPICVMHLRNSHKIDLEEKDIEEIVIWQADPLTQDKPWIKLYSPEEKKEPVKRVEKPPVVKDKDAVKDWWNKING